MNKFYPKSGSSFSIYGSGDVSNNAIARMTTIDKDGIQTTRPINVDGTYNANTQISYSYQYKLNKNFKLTARPTFSSGVNKAIIIVNGLRSGQNNYNYITSLTLTINYKDKIELNQRYTRYYRDTKYDNHVTYRNINVVTQYTETELVIRMPKHIVWKNLINYRYNPQVAQGIQKSSFRWNAGINYLFLKEEQGQLKLSVFDLLNQNINVNRSTGENYVIDTENSTLRRYFMLTFTNNLRNFTGARVGGRDRGMFLF